MPARTAAERSELASLAAHERWARSTAASRTAATGPGRAAWRARFERQVPDSITDPDDRRRAVDDLVAAFMIRERRTRRNQDRVLAEAIDILDAHGLADADEA